MKSAKVRQDRPTERVTRYLHEATVAMTRAYETSENYPFLTTLGFTPGDRISYESWLELIDVIHPKVVADILGRLQAEFSAWDTNWPPAVSEAFKKWNAGR